MLILKVAKQKNNFVKKIYLYASGAGATLAGLALASFASAQAMFEVPTSTASTLTANVGSQIGDPGTLLVIAVAAGIPLAFYVIHALLGLIPGRRSRRS